MCGFWNVAWFGVDGWDWNRDRIYLSLKLKEGGFARLFIILDSARCVFLWFFCEDE